METAKTSDCNPASANRKVCKRCGKPIRTEREYCTRCNQVKDKEKAYKSKTGSSVRQIGDSARCEQNRALAEMQATRQAKRRCHDCGRPTTNYRCEKCWARLWKKHGLPTDGDINIAEGWE